MTIHPSRPAGAPDDELTERMAAIRARLKSSRALETVHAWAPSELVYLLDALETARAERDEARAGYDRLMEALTAQTVLGARMAGVVTAARAALGMGTPALLGLALNDLRSALRVLDHEERRP